MTTKFWTTKRRVWYQKNDDDRLGRCTNKKCSLYNDTQGDAGIEEGQKTWECGECHKNLKVVKR